MKGATLGGKGEDPLGGNTQRQICLGGNQFLALKKKKKEIFRREMGFIYSHLLISCLFSFFMVVFSLSMSKSHFLRF